MGRLEAGGTKGAEGSGGGVRGSAGCEGDEGRRDGEGEFVVESSDLDGEGAVSVDGGGEGCFGELPAEASEGGGRVGLVADAEPESGAGEGLEAGGCAPVVVVCDGESEGAEGVVVPDEGGLCVIAEDVA